MSLSLLLTPVPPSRPARPPPSRESPAQIAADLEARTRALIAAFNSRDCAAFKALAAQHFSPFFRSGPCQFRAEHSCQQLLDCGVDTLERWPSYFLRVVRVDAHVGEEEEAWERGREEDEEGKAVAGPVAAQVFLFTELTGAPVSVKRRNVSVLQWRKRCGRWGCRRWDVIRGIGGPWVGEAV